MSAGVAEVKELARRRRRLQARLGCVPSTGGECPGFTMIITFTVQRRLRARAPEDSGGQVTPTA